MSQSPVKPITMKSVKLTYVATKTDIYKNENSYFKLSKKDIEKLNKIVVDGYKLPWFEGDNGNYILKAKHKNVKIPELVRDTVYIANLSFKHYSIDDIEGYYISLINI